MVTSQDTLEAISRAIRRSGRLPTDTSYIVGEPDPQGTDAAVTLPAVVVQEVVTLRDENRSTDLVDYVTDDAGRRIGRIWQANYDMDVQIDIHTIAGASEARSISTLEQQVRRALQRYDSQLRGESFPDEDGTDIGGIREFALGDSTPENDLTRTPSLLRQRFSASVGFVDRLNEVEEFGPIPTIETVLTPRDGDFVGDISEDYELEFQPPLDTAAVEQAVQDAGYHT